jgi:hypothetical protein
MAVAATASAGGTDNNQLKESAKDIAAVAAAAMASAMAVVVAAMAMATAKVTAMASSRVVVIHTCGVNSHNSPFNVIK